MKSVIKLFASVSCATLLVVGLPASRNLLSGKRQPASPGPFARGSIRVTTLDRSSLTGLRSLPASRLLERRL